MLDRFLDDPRVFRDSVSRIDLRSLQGDLEVPWRWLLGLAEERLSWKREPRMRLRRIIQRLREELVAESGFGHRRRRLDPLA